MGLSMTRMWAVSQHLVPQKESFLLHYLALFCSYEIGMMKYLFFLYNFVSLYKVNYMLTVENLENAYKQKRWGRREEEDWKGKKESEKRCRKGNKNSPSLHTIV